MKKTFTLIAAALPLLAAAQIQQIIVDTEELGFTSDLQSIDAGAVLGSSENVTMSMAYDDQIKSSAIKSNDITIVTIDGEELAVGQNAGVTGNGNPGNCALTSAATSGFVIRYDVTADGYMIVPSKLSSNKNYYVFEGLYGEGESPVAYTAGIIWDAGNGTEACVVDMPGDEMGYIDVETAVANGYCSETATKQLRYIITGDEATDLTGNGFGFLAFPVYAEAGSYLVYAQGSKISVNGCIFIPAEAGQDAADAKPASLSMSTEEGVEYVFWAGESGIVSIAADGKATTLDVNAPIYNVMGQRVSANTKGILIQNGVKFYNK